MRISLKFLSSLLVGVAVASNVCASELPPQGPIPFETYDTNKDGFISKEEFEKTRELRLKQSKEQKDRMMRNVSKAPTFESIDTDGDGKISKVELLESQMKQFQDRKNSCRGCK